MPRTITKKIKKPPGYLTDTISSLNKKRQVNEIDKSTINNDIILSTRMYSRKSLTKKISFKRTSTYFDPYSHFGEDNNILDPYGFFSQ